MAHIISLRSNAPSKISKRAKSRLAGYALLGLLLASESLIARDIGNINLLGVRLGDDERVIEGSDAQAICTSTEDFNRPGERLCTLVGNQPIFPLYQYSTKVTAVLLQDKVQSIFATLPYEAFDRLIRALYHQFGLADWSDRDFPERQNDPRWYSWDAGHSGECYVSQSEGQVTLSLKAKANRSGRSTICRDDVRCQFGPFIAEK